MENISIVPNVVVYEPNNTIFTDEVMIKYWARAEIDFYVKLESCFKCAERCNKQTSKELSLVVFDNGKHIGTRLTETLENFLNEVTIENFNKSPYRLLITLLQLFP